MSDEDLLDRIGCDPQSGICDVLSAYGPRLLGRLRKHAQDRRYGDADVEDVFQRALLRLLEPDARAEIRAAGGEILPWLSRWGYWRLDDLARAGAVAAQKTPPPVDPVAATNPSVAAQAVQEAIKRLSPRQQMVIRWRYEESVSNAEIGKRLAISEGAAKKTAHDARERIRKLLEETGIRYE